ncbi:hypothetical protein, partial [Bremerella sp. JC817]|uniref:hypothetical protein n=1 Tax=Bremerella sp. JC817 TaxID=3231756 RepID=UPI003459C4ED
MRGDPGHQLRFAVEPLAERLAPDQARIDDLQHPFGIQAGIPDEPDGPHTSLAEVLEHLVLVEQDHARMDQPDLP